MISALLSTLGIILAVVIVVLAATFGFASGMMHLLKFAIGKVKWLFGKE